MVANKTSTGLITPSRVIYVSDAADGFIYQIILKDENGNHLAFEEVTFTFNGKTRTAITDADGWAEINFTANAEGTYSIEVAFAGNNNYTAVSQAGSIKLVKEHTKFLAPNRVVYVTDLSKGYTYQAILKTKDGKALANKKVLITFNGKKQVAMTDENGWVTFKLAASKAGVYQFSLKFAGDRYYDAVEETRTIKAIKEPVYLMSKGASFSADAPVKEVSVTVQSKTGTKVMNAKVALKVNGVTYIGMTNSDGVALIKFSLNQKGVYKAIVKYAGTSLYDAREGTTKILIK